MIEIISARFVASGMSECSASGVQVRDRASDVIMPKFEGLLESEWLVALRVESSVAAHLQKF